MYDDSHLFPWVQLNQRLVFVEEKDDESHQFISAAGDGTVSGAAAALMGAY